jgi:hypothetical protein
MGQLYNHVVDKELAQKAGYKDTRDYFRLTRATSDRTAPGRSVPGSGNRVAGARPRIG